MAEVGLCNAYRRCCPPIGLQRREDHLLAQGAHIAIGVRLQLEAKLASW